MLTRSQLFAVLCVLATSSSAIAKPISLLQQQQPQHQVAFSLESGGSEETSAAASSHVHVFSSAAAQAAADARIPAEVLAVLPDASKGKEAVSAWDPAQALLEHAALVSSAAIQNVHDSQQDAEDAVEALRQRLSEPKLLWLPELGPEDDAVAVAAAESSTGSVRWMTEGDKLRLRKEGRWFVDVTEAGSREKKRQDELSEAMMAGKANLPPLMFQRHIRPVLATLSPDPITGASPAAASEMHRVLTKMTGFYSRYYWSEEGEKSSRWLRDEIAKIIDESPFRTYISLETFTHRFPQPSIIARFEMATGRNASAPLTILGAHQDSANYLFPLLPAPGADDDMSGSASILEAFRALAQHGYVPSRGPVEFHWYAAEEAGLLGSLEIVDEYKKLKRPVGAMMNFDMTAFIARNATESITFLRNDADAALTEWSVKLAKEYLPDLAVKTSELPKGAGSDYMSWDRAGYPAAFATEGDPWPSKGKPQLSATTSSSPALGEFDPYVHTTGDRMDVDDAAGVYSIRHALDFSKYAVAFAVEQAGWSEGHTREGDGDGRRKSKD